MLDDYAFLYYRFAYIYVNIYYIHERTYKILLIIWYKNL